MLQVVPNTRIGGTGTGTGGGGAGTDAAPSDDEVLDCLVSNNGIVLRVAVKLGITEADVFRIVARNPKKLSTRLRAAAMVQSYATMVKVSAALDLALQDMQPDAVGRTYAATLASFGQLAGQFEEAEEVDSDDDVTAGKEFILERLAEAGKREALEGLTQQQDVAG